MIKEYIFERPSVIFQRFGVFSSAESTLADCALTLDVYAENDFPAVLRMAPERLPARPAQFAG